MAQGPRLRFAKSPPKAAPDRVARTLFPDGNRLELVVKVTGKSGIEAYGFAFAGAPVVMSGGEGAFFATRGDKRLLEWVMVGQPGGHMKVTVENGEQTVAERDESTIPAGFGKGYDALDILVL